jgi:hypothetical protein
MLTYKTLGLVWFDKDQQGEGGIDHQDWRIENDPLAQPSFQLGIRDELAVTLPPG